MNKRSYRKTGAEWAVVPYNHYTANILGDKDILVSKDGKYVVNPETWIPYRQYDRNGYRWVNLNGKSIAVHRLMALAWLSWPAEAPDRWVVNHIDGVKHNNHIENLEWGTYKENIEHAYRVGLRPDNRIILVKDLRDGSIREFNTLQECAREFKINGGLLHYYLRDITRVRMKYFVFITKGQEWPDLTEKDINESEYNGSINRPIVAKNKETKEVLKFASVLKCSKHFNVNTTTLSTRLKRNSKDSPNPIFQLWDFKFMEGDEALKYQEELAEERRTRFTNKEPIPIKVISPSGKITYWDSSQAFADSVGAKKNTIQKSVYLKGDWRGYRIMYLKPKDHRPHVKPTRKDIENLDFGIEYVKETEPKQSENEHV